MTPMCVWSPSVGVFILLMLAALMRWSRWKLDKEHIGQSKRPNMKREVQCDPNSECNVVIRMLMSPSNELQHRRAVIILEGSDKAFILTVVKKHGIALQFAHPSLRSDKDVVLAAVTQNADALQYAHGKFHWDDDVLRAAGILRSAEGVIYADYFGDGRKQYCGNKKDGLYHNQGTLFSPDGTRLYEGQWVMGKRHGEGKEFGMISRNGVRHEVVIAEGTWASGKRSGQCTLFKETESGRRHIVGSGSWADNEFSGTFYHLNEREAVCLTYEVTNALLAWDPTRHWVIEPESASYVCEYEGEKRRLVCKGSYKAKKKTGLWSYWHDFLADDTAAISYTRDEDKSRVLNAVLTGPNGVELHGKWSNKKKTFVWQQKSSKEVVAHGLLLSLKDGQKESSFFPRNIQVKNLSFGGWTLFGVKERGQDCSAASVDLVFDSKMEVSQFIEDNDRCNHRVPRWQAQRPPFGCFPAQVKDGQDFEHCFGRYRVDVFSRTYWKVGEWATCRHKLNGYNTFNTAFRPYDVYYTQIDYDEEGNVIKEYPVVEKLFDQDC